MTETKVHKRKFEPPFIHILGLEECQPLLAGSGQEKGEITSTVTNPNGTGADGDFAKLYLLEF